MDMNSKVSAPPYAAPKNPTTQPPVEEDAPGGSGFNGMPHPSTVNSDRGITKGGNGQTPVPGFSSGGGRIKAGKL